MRPDVNSLAHFLNMAFAKREGSIPSACQPPTPSATPAVRQVAHMQLCVGLAFLITRTTRPVDLHAAKHTNKNNTRPRYLFHAGENTKPKSVLMTRSHSDQVSHADGSTTRGELPRSWWPWAGDWDSTNASSPTLHGTVFSDARLVRTPFLATPYTAGTSRRTMERRATDWCISLAEPLQQPLNFAL